MTEHVKPVVLVSRSLLSAELPEGVELCDVTPWLMTEHLVWEGVLPLAVMLDTADSLSSKKSGIEALNVPVIEATKPEDLGKQVVTALLDAAHCQQAANTALRMEAAELRRDFMALQQSFNATEDFLYTAFAPQFTCARAWPHSGESVPSGTIRQRLPVGSTGLVAVDFWAMQAGSARLRFCRETGEDFAPEILIQATAGWQRAQLDLPISGLSEDIALEISSDFALGLSLSTPLEMMHATGASAPLALRVWKGLPGVRLPEMEGGARRHILPASSLPVPEVLGSGAAKPLRERDAISLHPGHDGKLDVVFRGVPVSGAANIAAYVQNFGPETVELSMALGKDAKARSIYLQADSHGQCDVDITSAGKVDLYFSLKAPSPMVCVYIRGLEIYPVAG